MNALKEREKLYQLLGELPDRKRSVTCRTALVETREHYVLEKLVLSLNGIEDVPASFEPESPLASR